MVTVNCERNHDYLLSLRLGVILYRKTILGLT